MPRYAYLAYDQVQDLWNVVNEQDVVVDVSPDKHRAEAARSEYDAFRNINSPERRI